MPFHFLNWLRSWKAPALLVVLVFPGVILGHFPQWYWLYILTGGIFDFLLIAIPLAWVVKGFEKLLKAGKKDMPVQQVARHSAKKLIK